MKKVFAIFILFMVIASFAKSEEKGKHLFILSGQSNMERLNPNLSFTPELVKKLGEGNFIVVKNAKGGQPINRWYKNWVDSKGVKGKNSGDLYDALMKDVHAAIKGQQIATITFVWMQGERDAKEKYGEVYAASLIGVISQLKEDLKSKDIKCVLGRLSDFDLENKEYPHWTMVREAIEKVANSSRSYAWVDTDDLNDIKGKNDLHLSAEGYKIFGERLANKAIELLSKK